MRNNGIATINNSTFSGNSASFGGGVTNTRNRTLTLNNCTFSGNFATFNSNAGGGIRNDGTLNYSRTIIANSLSGGDCSNTSTIGTNSFNLVEDSTCSATYSGDPGLGVLADNGGPANTHALQPGSIAIDVVPNNTSTNNIDQRGAVRDYDGNGVSSSNEGDIGAYEYRAPTQQCGLTTSTNYTVENVTLNFSTLGSLTCVTVDEMGPNVSHLLATGPGASGVGIQTGNWWHITGNGSGFNVSITLPYATADNNSRVCKYPGNLGGYGRDCDDGTNTTYVSNSSVTRSGITSFSDWAVGDYVGPTAVTVANLQVHSATPVVAALLAVTLIFAGGLTALHLRRKSTR